MAKRTLAVRLGNGGALGVAMGFTVLAAVAGTTFHLTGWAQGAYEGIAYFVVPHAAWLMWLLWRERQRGAPDGRIDGLMAVSLAYVLWFGLVPLVNLAAG